MKTRNSTADSGAVAVPIARLSGLASPRTAAERPPASPGIEAGARDAGDPALDRPDVLSDRLYVGIPRVEAPRRLVLDLSQG